jgi:hypothetical protein
MLFCPSPRGEKAGLKGDTVPPGGIACNQLFDEQCPENVLFGNDINDLISESYKTFTASPARLYERTSLGSESQINLVFRLMTKKCTPKQGNL